MADQYSNPNQEVVRPDGSGPADEGSGGSQDESKDKGEEKSRTPAAQHQQPRAEDKPKSEEKGKAKS